MLFSNRLKELLDANNVNWKQVSTELSIGKNQQKYWEDHQSAPDGKTLIKLAEYFNVSVDYLLGVENRNAILEEKALLMVSDMSEQENALISMFRSTSEEGRLRIIHAVVEIHNEEEKKIAPKNTESVG